MNRREFVRKSVLCLLGMMAWDANWPEAEACREPMIYKGFLRFTEYEYRKATEYIVIHHVGIPDVDKDSAATAIHKYHQEHNGWSGIGYHYLIRKDGTIEQGRQPEMVGRHAYEHNQTSVGVCLAGNFDVGQPTEKQMASVKELCRWLCRKYGLDSRKKVSAASTNESMGILRTMSVFRSSLKIFAERCYSPRLSLLLSQV